MQSKYTSISKDVKFTMVAAVVSCIIMLPILLHLTSTSSNASVNNVILVGEETTSYDSDEVSTLTQFQTTNEFRKLSASGLQEDDISDFVIGQQSLKLTTDGNSSPVFTRKTGIAPSIDMTDKSVAIWLKVSNAENLGELRVTVTGDRFQTLRNYWIDTKDGKIGTPLIDNEWILVTISPENIRDFGSPDVSKIDTIQLRVVDKGGNNPVTIWFNGLALVDTG